MIRQKRNPLQIFQSRNFYHKSSETEAANLKVDIHNWLLLFLRDVQDCLPIPPDFHCQLLGTNKRWCQRDPNVW